MIVQSLFISLSNNGLCDDFIDEIDSRWNAMITATVSVHNRFFCAVSSMM